MLGLSSFFSTCSFQFIFSLISLAVKLVFLIWYEQLVKNFYSVTKHQFTRLNTNNFNKTVFIFIFIFFTCPSVIQGIISWFSLLNNLSIVTSSFTLWFHQRNSFYIKIRREAHRDDSRAVSARYFVLIPRSSKKISKNFTIFLKIKFVKKTGFDKMLNSIN
jgi:hypothetical protein